MTSKNILPMSNQTEISVPGFQYFMLPFLQVMSDGKTRHMNEVNELVIKQTGLTAEQCSVLLPSKADTLVRNRIGWVRTYLYKAGLISQVSRGNYHISEAGLRAIKEQPNSIDIKYLKTQPAFQAWGSSFSNDKESVESGSSPVETFNTPQELLENSYQIITNSVAEELLDRIKKASPAFFERLVVDVLLAMGYGGFDNSNGQVTQYSGDGGIDGIIKEDKLGLDTIYIQAKRWESGVPVSAVRDFAGSLLSKKARKGVFITTSYFPQSAYEYVKSIDPTIILIDGEQLTKIMIEYNVAVTKSKTYEIKRIDNDYFEM
jgi:restriction system protein